MDGLNHYDTFTSRWTAPDPLDDEGGDPDWYGYCLDDPVNLADPSGLMGCKPEEPEEPEGPYQSDPYFEKSWQWQSSPGACEKCQALDGRMFHGDLSGVPERPHPNCKCEVVECQYFSKYGEKKGVERVVVGDRIVKHFGPINVTVLWERTMRIGESRERTYWRQCGSREPEFMGNGETKTKYRYEKIQVESGGFVAQDLLQMTTPWTGKGVRIPVFPWN